MAASISEVAGSVEIVSDRRRRHDAAFRAEVVAASLVSGVRVRDVARRHGICTSLVYRWRRGCGAQLGCGDPGLRLVPVHITGDVPRPVAAGAASHGLGAGLRRGMIEIALADDVCIRVDDTVNLAALRRVLSVLRR